MKIVAQAPCRISLFGGGTDVDPFASKYGGICLNLAINIRQRVEIDDSLIGNVLPEGASHEFYKVIFSEMGQPLPPGLFCYSDSPIESGLGSSASAAVALVGAISKIKGLNLTKDEIAEKAWDIEVNKLKMFGGKQDQYAAVYGGGNMLIFEDKVYRYPLKRDGIEKIYPYMCLFYTGKNRKSPTIQEGFKNPTIEQLEALNNIKDIAYNAITPMNKGDIESVASLLRTAWEEKKKSNRGVSNEFLDNIYNVGRENGAFAGKVLGAGGGGHFLLLIEPTKRNSLIEALAEMGVKWVDFSLDWNGLETRII